MPWVSVQGAGLLAQILPIAILIIVINARATARAPRVKVNRFMYSRASSVVTGFGALLGVYIIVLCWIGVNDGKPLTGIPLWIVFLGSPLVVLDAGYVLLDLIEQLWKAESVGLEKASEPTAAKPRAPQPRGRSKRQNKKR